MRRALLLLVALGMWIPGLAFAQDNADQYGLDIERFKPALDSQGVILTEGGQGEEAGDLNLGFYLHWADDELVFRRGDDVVGRLVDERIAGSFLLSMGMTRWLTLGVEVPAAFYQTGQVITTGASGSQYSDLASAALGDIRVVPKFTLLREKTMGISLAVVVPVSLPSGDETAYLGSNNVTVAPSIALSRHFLKDRLLLAANLGFWFREAADYQDLKTSHEFFYKLGLGFRFAERFWALGEAVGASKLSLVTFPGLNVYRLACLRG